MKINKRKPTHWYRLFCLSLVTLLAAGTRLLRKPTGDKPLVVLYGHKLHGNLKSLYKELTGPGVNCLVYFLTIDPDYYKTLREAGYQCLSGLKLRTATALAESRVIVSDHGLHSLSILLHCSNIKFVDVWHGIPFKGFDEKDFRTQQAYNEIWVSSQQLKRLYIERFGFTEQQVYVTGYGRTDKLINPANTDTIKQSLGIDGTVQPLILFAPTWAQDERGRSLYPFGRSESEFLSALSEFGKHHSCLFLVRHHLNSDGNSKSVYSNVKLVPSQTYPDTEDILLISDMLICDWSSIAFDFLALDRPTLFLDVPPPFSKGLSLPAHYRFGHITSSMEDLKNSLAEFLRAPDNYFSRYADKHKQVKQAVYDDTLDGKSASRYHQRLRQLLNQ